MQAGRRGRPHHYVPADLREAEIEIHGRTGEVCCVDDAGSKRRLNLRARESDGARADRLKTIGDEAAGHPQVQLAEIIERSDRLVRMDQVHVVVNVTNVVEIVAGIEFAGQFRSAIAVEQHVPLVRMRQPHRERGQEGASWHCAGDRGVMWNPMHCVQYPG